MLMEFQITVIRSNERAADTVNLSNNIVSLSETKQMELDCVNLAEVNKYSILMLNRDEKIIWKKIFKICIAVISVKLK